MIRMLTKKTKRGKKRRLSSWTTWSIKLNAKFRRWKKKTWFYSKNFSWYFKNWTLTWSFCSCWHSPIKRCTWSAYQTCTDFTWSSFGRTRRTGWSWAGIWACSWGTSRWRSVQRWSESCFFVWMKRRSGSVCRVCFKKYTWVRVANKVQ